jgi:hypothetical protein
MLVRPHDGGVDDQVLKVRVFDQGVENTLPNALLGPPTEAREYAVPFAKLIRQIAPRRSGASRPKHGIDEKPIVIARPPSVASLTRYKPFNPPPLPIREFPPNQDRLPQLRS